MRLLRAAALCALYAAACTPAERSTAHEGDGASDATTAGGGREGKVEGDASPIDAAEDGRTDGAQDGTPLDAAGEANGADASNGENGSTGADASKADAAEDAASDAAADGQTDAVVEDAADASGDSVAEAGSDAAALASCDEVAAAMRDAHGTHGACEQDTDCDQPLFALDGRGPALSCASCCSVALSTSEGDNVLTELALRWVELGCDIGGCDDGDPGVRRCVDERCTLVPLDDE